MAIGGDNEIVHLNSHVREREMSERKVVCVTGGSGYIASWLVKLLLSRGYTVKASVHDSDDPQKTNGLRSLDGANERLHIFKANLLEGGSFDTAIDGCEGVFYVASPVVFETTNPQEELIGPALKGTLNVLGACVRTSSVKRVVVTSSMAAVAHNRKPRGPDVFVDETWFSDAEFCRDNKVWYPLSKTLAEEVAWDFAKEKGIDLVVMNPALVMGPLLLPALNAGATAILKLINGSSTFPNEAGGCVDVRDVAEAHLLAFEVASASGRYCLAERVAHFSEIVKILQELYPALKLPERCAVNDEPFDSMYQISSKRAKSLGINYIPLEESLKDTVESLKEEKFVDY